MQLNSLHIVRDLLKDEILTAFLEQHGVDEITKLPFNEQANVELLLTLSHHLASDDTQPPHTGNDNYVMHGAALAYAEQLRLSRRSWIWSAGEHKGHLALMNKLNLNQLTPQEEITLLNAYKNFISLNANLVTHLQTSRGVTLTSINTHLDNLIQTNEKRVAAEKAPKTASGWLSPWSQKPAPQAPAVSIQPPRPKSPGTRSI